jgi:hypothetical protein
MPQVYTYAATFSQPVRVTFSCEFCGNNFQVDGKVTAEAKTEKWTTPGSSEAQLELQGKGEAKLNSARSSLEDLIKRGTFPTHFNSEGIAIRFASSNVCPECGYKQRMANAQEVPTKTRILRGGVGIGCGGLIVFLYFSILVNYIRGLEFDLRPAALPILVGVPVLTAVVAFLLRNPNRRFLKAHGMKKNELPQPRLPDIDFGQAVRTE